ncbi:Na(+)/citrate cotransporter-like [Conger conger]|uniref:Na(+)/citrate cotransporter-like n=1 Tax=Conger conger TaxID=82655 RepID=UPI002A5A8043|nr:Na(+)/citrate cotransporter-like [Conger conger]
MAVYWCTEALPMAVTALLPIVLFPVFSIMRSREVSIQYLNDGTMLLLGTLVVAVAVEHWNLHKRIALRMLYPIRVRPPLLMLGFMCVTAFLSMWISNTATTAMMVPIIQAVLQQLHYREEEVQEHTPVERVEEQRELVVVNGSGVYEETVPIEEAAEKRRICKGMMLSVCYAASIRGTATLTGTGANLVLQGQMNHFRKTWGCGVRRSEEEEAMFRVVRDELRQLGPISFGEGSVLVLFLLLILLWFTRDPGFTTGWARSLLSNNTGYVNDATLAVFIAVLMFILPSQAPRLSLFFPCPRTGVRIVPYVLGLFEGKKLPVMGQPAQSLIKRELAREESNSAKQTTLSLKPCQHQSLTHLEMKLFLKTLRKLKNGIILFCTPFLLLPLPVLIRTKEAGCAYVILLMAVYWCTEALPMAVTALLPVVLFPVFGIMRSREVSIQYLNDTTMLCLGTLVVALAVEHWNLHKRLALRMLYLTGVRPPLLMLSFMCVTAFLSMWTNTMAASAMITPIVQAVLQQLHYREEERGEEQRELVVVNGSGVYEETVPFEEAAEKRRICKGMKLSVCYAASIGGTATLTATGANLVLQGQMNQLFPTNGDVITFTSWFTFAFPNMIIMLFISWFWLQFIAMGLNFRKTWGCGVRRSEEEVAMFRVVRDELRQLGSISFGEGSVLVLFLLLILLWFTRDPGFTTGWARSLLGNNAGYVNDATVAVFIAVLMFILPSQPPRLSLFFPCPHTESQTSPVPPVLLNWKVVQAKMPWDLLLLLGGGFALAKGCEVSGLSRWMGIQMTPLQTIPPWATVIILCLLISIFTEFTSNVAAVTLFLPILASMSQSFGLNPLYLIVPCTLSASFAFMLPVATPVNAIVFSYGDLQASDMAKAGIGMNIIGILCCTLAINTWGRAVFILDSFPTWANITSV